MKRVKKILLWTGISVGTSIALLLIVFACYNWIIGSQLEKRLAAIKAACEPICLADLARKPIPPEQNGETYLKQAKDGINAVYEAMTEVVYDTDGEYTADGLKKVLAVIDAHPDIYPLLEKTAACPDFDTQLEFSLPPTKFIENCINDITNRDSARFLDVWIRGLLLKGRVDEALQADIVMLKISRLSEKEPLLIKYMIAEAIRSIALSDANIILRTGTISSQFRMDLEKELSLHGSMDIFRRVLKSERAFSLDSIRNHKFLGSWIWSKYYQLSFLDVFDEYHNYLLKPYSDWAVEDERRAESKSPFDVITVLTRPEYRSVLTIAYRSQTQVRAIRIINALQATAPADSDKIPTMAELGLPDEVGIDPFNGQPMIIKKLPEGWLVYSVGKNLKDDGGSVSENGPNALLDIGFGPIISATKK